MNALLERWTGVMLLEPAFLLVALLVPVALFLRRPAPSLAFAPSALAAERPLPVSWRVRALGAPVLLQSAALLLVAVALARPVHRIAIPNRTEGIDILLALDVSSSMTANDMDRRRTRLEVAKDGARDFVKGRKDDRVGLVAFARYPDVVCPPTLDHEALLAILARVATVESDGPEDATGIGTAVARAAQTLRVSPSKSRVVILFTDGEETVATTKAPGEIAPIHAAQLCSELGIRVYAIAAGGPAAGRAPIDTGPVQRLAERTGGRFFSAEDAGSVANVYAAIDALEKAKFEEPRYEIVERFLPFVVAAVACLLAARLAQDSVLRVLP